MQEEPLCIVVFMVTEIRSMPMLRFLILPLAVTAISSAHAATLYETGDKLFLQCKGSDAIGILSCIAYIEGAVDQIELMRSERGKAGCVPQGVTGRELQDIVIDYFETHPQARQDAAAPAVKDALYGAWNCK